MIGDDQLDIRVFGENPGKFIHLLLVQAGDQFDQQLQGPVEIAPVDDRRVRMDMAGRNADDHGGHAGLEEMDRAAKIVTVDFVVQVESAVKLFGPERLLYGSGLPVGDPAMGIGMVNYGKLASREKELIAGGNLSRLLESVE